MKARAAAAIVRLATALLPVTIAISVHHTLAHGPLPIFPCELSYFGGTFPATCWFGTGFVVVGACLLTLHTYFDRTEHTYFGKMGALGIAGVGLLPHTQFFVLHACAAAICFLNYICYCYLVTGGGWAAKGLFAVNALRTAISTGPLLLLSFVFEFRPLDVSTPEGIASIEAAMANTNGFLALKISRMAAAVLQWITVAGLLLLVRSSLLEQVKERAKEEADAETTAKVFAASYAAASVEQKVEQKLA